MTNGGCRFEINQNDYADIDEQVLDGDDEDDIDRDTDDPATASPWLKSFAELIETMSPIGGHRLHKRIVREGRDNVLGETKARVRYHYSAFFEKDEQAFDSTYIRNRPEEIVIDESSILPGLEFALQTMRVTERAQFVIGYELLYGAMGCPPRVKPKTDCLFVIDMVGFNETGDMNALDNISQEDKHKFPAIKIKVAEVMKRAKDSYNNGRLPLANKAYDTAIKHLEFCQLSSEEEEKEQRSLLVQLYRNQAVCYNRRELWTKTCCMCQELQRLSNSVYIFKSDCKAQFAWGRALMNMGEYDRARELLLRAQRLEPGNKDINKVSVFTFSSIC